MSLFFVWKKGGKLSSEITTKTYFEFLTFWWFLTFCFLKHLSFWQPLHLPVVSAPEKFLVKKSNLSAKKIKNFYILNLEEWVDWFFQFPAWSKVTAFAFFVRFLWCENFDYKSAMKSTHIYFVVSFGNWWKLLLSSSKGFLLKFI